MSLRSFASAFPPSMFGSNDGQDSDTDCSFLGLFSRLENVSNVHSKADDRKGDDFERRNGGEWRGCADMFVLGAALLLACVNIYWNYAISILSRPKSIRSLREDGRGERLRE